MAFALSLFFPKITEHCLYRKFSTQNFVTFSVHKCNIVTKMVFKINLFTVNPSYLVQLKCIAQRDPELTRPHCLFPLRRRVPQDNSS